MELVAELYALTKTFPKEESFGLVSQMRRAAVSIPSNIAEGSARKSPKEFANFLSIARGSVSELDTQLELAERLGFIKKTNYEQIDQLLERVDKMLYALSRKVTPKS